MSGAAKIGLSLLLAGGGAALIYAIAGSRGGEKPYPDRVDPVPVHDLDLGTGARTPVGAGPAEEAPHDLARAGATRLSEVNDRAIEALEAGRLEEAVSLFEECREGDPEEPVFAANLAEALARLARDEYTSAVDPSIPIDHLRRATEIAPHREDLAALLERWQKTAETEKDFWTDETDHFRLSYDGNRPELLRRGYAILTAALESAYLDFVAAFGQEPVEAGDPKIRVVLYRRDEFTDLTGIGHWAGGVYDGVVRIPVVDFDAQRAGLERVLRHELVHAFVRDAGGGEVPAWLNEGLAQWHEQAGLEARQAKVKAARRILADGGLLPLDDLRNSLSRSKDEDWIERAYAQSVAMIAFLERWYGERILYQMVEGCGEGRSCRETFVARTAVSLDDVVADLAAGL